MTEIEFTVGESEAGERADVLAARHAPALSRSRTQSLIRAGLVLVDGRPVKPGWGLKAGQRVQVRLPDPEPMADRPQAIPLKIVHEDELLVVVDKPAGMVVHPGAGNPDRTLVNALLHLYPEMEGVGGVRRPGLVHRLDRETSGLLVVAKTDQACRELQEQFRRRTVEKNYLAVVYGRWPAEVELIDRPIGRNPRARQRMAVLPDGRPARTRVLEQAAGGPLSRLELRLETGRTHQARVHLASLGHPVVGDAVYGRGRERDLPAGKLRRLIEELKGIALHARRLAFDHPATGQRVVVESPVPRRLRALLAAAGLDRPGDLPPGAPVEPEESAA